MQIQLKQAEIVAALKQYITKQGIDLSSKLVEIRFTAGRKDGGLLADVTIDEDNFIPGIDDAASVAAAAQKPTLTTIAPFQRPAMTEVEITVPAPTATPGAAPEPITELAAPETATPTKSLFG